MLCSVPRTYGIVHSSLTLHVSNVPLGISTTSQNHALELDTHDSRSHNFSLLACFRVLLSVEH
jgi:hypothetical protein